MVAAAIFDFQKYETNCQSAPVNMPNLVKI